MKILYILSGTYSFGGASKSFLNLCRGVAQEGIEIKVVCPDDNGLYQILKLEGYNVSSISYKLNIYPHFKTWRNKVLWLPLLIRTKIINYRATLKLTKLVKEFKPDIIHSNVGCIDIGFRISKKLNIPHISHLREYQDLDFGYRWIGGKRNFIKCLNYSSNYSICITKDIQKYFNLDSDKSIVIYNGIFNINTDLSYNFSIKKHQFLFAGRLEKAKGIEECINAYILLKKHRNFNFPLIIAGDTNDEAYKIYLKQLVKNSGLDKEIKFLGNVKDISKLYSESWAIIISSRFEGFGRSTAEAMMNKCLVIGKNTGGTKEQLDNAQQLCGQEVGFRYNSIEELINVMEEVLVLPQNEYNRMTNNAYYGVSSLYTIQGNVEKTINYYKYILKKSI